VRIDDYFINLISIDENLVSSYLVGRNGKVFNDCCWCFAKKTQRWVIMSRERVITIQ